MNKKVITVVSIAAAGLIVIFGAKAAMSSSTRNDALQMDRKNVTTNTTTASIPETTTTRTDTSIETTTETTTTAVDSEETTTVTTTLPKEIIPEVTTTVPTVTNPEVTTTTTPETTTVTTTTETPTTTTEINPENIEDITLLSYEDVRDFVIANFDDYPENYEITVRNRVFYLNDYVVVFTNMQNVGELKETSLGMGIVVSSWARTGYVIVMENFAG